MLINVCIIEAEGMVGATPQNYMSCLFVAVSQKLYSLFGFLMVKILKFHGTFNHNCSIIKCKAGGVVGAFPYENMAIFYKA